MADDDEAPAEAPVPRHPLEVGLDRPEEVAYWVARLNRSQDDIELAVQIAGVQLPKVLRALSVIGD